MNSKEKPEQKPEEKPERSKPESGSEYLARLKRLDKSIADGMRKAFGLPTT